MKETRNNPIIKFLPYVVAVFGLLAFIMIFLDALLLEGEPFLKGTEAAFGKSLTILGQKFELKFNILAFFGYVFPVLAAIYLVAPIAKGRKTLKYIIVTAWFVAAALLLFVMPSYIKVVYTTVFGSGKADSGTSLAIGAILGGVFSLVGGVGSATLIVLDK